MRTIKFKGKEKTGEWRYGDYIAPDYTDFGTYIRGREMVHGDGFSAEGLYEVIPETVGQFTGLKDRNGKEIYEGDVIERMGHTGTAVVVFKDGMFHPFTNHDFAFHADECEIIGNIHEAHE